MPGDMDVLFLGGSGEVGGIFRHGFSVVEKPFGGDVEVAVKPTHDAVVQGKGMEGPLVGQCREGREGKEGGEIGVADFPGVETDAQAGGSNARQATTFSNGRRPVSGKQMPFSILMSILSRQRLDFAGGFAADGAVPCGIQFALVDGQPGGQDAHLLGGKGARQHATCRDGHHHEDTRRHPMPAAPPREACDTPRQQGHRRT